MMYEFLEAVVLVLVAIFVLWEIIIPGIMGTPLFPFLNRGHKARLESDRQKLVAQIEDGNLAKEVKRLADELEKIKAGASNDKKEEAKQG